MMIVVERTNRLELGTIAMKRQVVADQGDNVDRLLDGGEGGFRLPGHKVLL